MSDFRNTDHEGIQTTAQPAGELSVVWETETYYVQTSGAPEPFAIQLLHGYRRDDAGGAASPDADRQTVLAVHGLMHNALFFQPLGDELLAHPGRQTSHFYAISLPGHGDLTRGSTHGMSGIPGHRRYGDMPLEDYAEALIQIAAQLGRIDTIIAHSQGGIVVQLAETMLQASGTSFRSEALTHTRRMVLVASTLPGGVPWEASDSGVLASILGSLDAIKSDPAKGLFLSISDASWARLFYSLPMLADPAQPIAGGPDVATEVPHLRADAPTVASFNSMGLGQPRPSVPAGLFERFSFFNVAFQEDSFMTAADHDRLGNYLKPGAGHILIASQPDAPAIHCALYTRPASLLPFLLGEASAQAPASRLSVAA